MSSSMKYLARKAAKERAQECRTHPPKPETRNNRHGPTWFGNHSTTMSSDDTSGSLRGGKTKHKITLPKMPWD